MSKSCPCVWFLPPSPRKLLNQLVITSLANVSLNKGGQPPLWLRLGSAWAQPTSLVWKKSSRADSVCTLGGLEGLGASFPSSSQYYFTARSQMDTVRFSVVFLDVHRVCSCSKWGVLSSVVPLGSRPAPCISSYMLRGIHFC